MQKDLKEQLARCIELMQKDVAEFEAKHQGRLAEEPHVGRARDGEGDHRLALQELRRTRLRMLRQGRHPLQCCRRRRLGPQGGKEGRRETGQRNVGKCK